MVHMHYQKFHQTYNDKKYEETKNIVTMVLNYSTKNVNETIVKLYNISNFKISLYKIKQFDFAHSYIIEPTANKLKEVAWSSSHKKLSSNIKRKIKEDFLNQSYFSTPLIDPFSFSYCYFGSNEAF